MSVPSSSSEWPKLLNIAQAETRQTLQALPAKLRTQAEPLPVTFEPRPTQDLIEDGVEPDTLGLFVGEPFPESASGALQLPAQIILYLENIWDAVEANEADYRREIRATLLHELGHYLGLDEIDLEDRGLG